MIPITSPVHSLPDSDCAFADYPLTEKPLGPRYAPEGTAFYIWAPTVKALELLLYVDAHTLHRTHYPMTPSEDGVFSVHISGDLHGRFYTFLVEGRLEVTDPYSVSTSANGIRSAVVDASRTDPEGWEQHPRPSAAETPCDAILYEVHVKDFSAHPSGGMQNRGKFLAFSEAGTTLQTKGVANSSANSSANSRADSRADSGTDDTEAGALSTGLDHLVELGITHVHLLPVFDYLTVDETAPMEAQYNWGYDPEHFNAPEGSYATDPEDPVCRMKELKTAIMALHARGIKVVLDVVYNHTYRGGVSNFNALVPDYYYRLAPDGSFSNGSGCGNEFASEHPMARRFIIDSLTYWAREYQVDGFRFDLMALIDLDTVTAALEAVRTINPDILFYGEPWTGGLTPLPEFKRVYKGAQCGKGFAVFNDDFRNAIKGDNDGTQPGYIQCNRDMKHAMHTGIAGSIAYTDAYIGFADSPCESVNYFNAHDNLILQDKLKRSAPGASDSDMSKLTKLAFSILFTAQGIPFFHAGNEFMRDKKGNHNSYNAPLSVNGIDWSLKRTHHDVFEYVKDLIALRKAFPCLRLHTTDEVRNRLHFLEESAFEEAFRDAIVYALHLESDPASGCLLIAHNPGWTPLHIDRRKVVGALCNRVSCGAPGAQGSGAQGSGAQGSGAQISAEGIRVEKIWDEHGRLTPSRPAGESVLYVAPVSTGIFILKPY